MVFRTTKSHLDNEEHEDLSFNHQLEDKSKEQKVSRKVTKVNCMSVTAASNPTKMDLKIKIFNEKP